MIVIPTTQYKIFKLLTRDVYAGVINRPDGFVSESIQQAKGLIQYQILSMATLFSAAS
jgi:hypothetical protein